MHALFKKGKMVIFHLVSLLLLAYMLVSIVPTLDQQLGQQVALEEQEAKEEQQDTQQQESQQYGKQQQETQQMLQKKQGEVQQDTRQEKQQQVAQHTQQTAHDQDAQPKSENVQEVMQNIHVKSPEEVTVSSSVSTMPDSIQVVGPTEAQLKKLRSVEVIATGYTAGYESTGKTPDHPEYGITYSGIPVRRDHLSTIAADLDLFPLGTILWIPDYGYGIVSDIGGAIKGNKIDLYYETEDDVYRYWGKKTVDVYVIEEGSGELTEVIFGEKRDAFAG